MRAFSYFSHLANLAEDVHQNRRRRAHAFAGSAPQSGSTAHAFQRLREAGIAGAQLRTFFADALVSPVLTAHPTEVQRKSILDCEREIVRLLQWRDRSALTPDELATMQTGLYRQVLTLWQTAMLRLTKLQVKDEIDNGVAYYRYTFLDEIPRLYADLEAHARDFGDGANVPAFLVMGSWIGGDRDGNPFVGADTLQYANRAQATGPLAHHRRSASARRRASLSARLVTPTPDCSPLAALRTIPIRTAATNRIGRRSSASTARLAATAMALTGYAPRRPPHARCRVRHAASSSRTSI